MLWFCIRYDISAYQKSLVLYLVGNVCMKPYIHLLMHLNTMRKFINIPLVKCFSPFNPERILNHSGSTEVLELIDCLITN